jgi:hypothetical protein
MAEKDEVEPGTSLHLHCMPGYSRVEIYGWDAYLMGSTQASKQSVGRKELCISRSFRAHGKDAYTSSRTTREQCPYRYLVVVLFGESAFREFKSYDRSMTRPHAREQQTVLT